MGGEGGKEVGRYILFLTQDRGFPHKKVLFTILAREQNIH
jgi:hypothetical protein